MQGHAEDLELRAEMAATFRVLLVDLTARDDMARARRMKGPTPADAARDRLSRRDDGWRSGDELALTVSATTPDPATEPMRRLLALGGVKGLTVDVLETHPPTAEHVGRVTLDRNEWVSTTRRPNESTALRFESGFAEAVAHEIWSTGETFEEVLATTRAFVAHESLGNDLFLTTNPFMLEHRWDRAWLVGKGICSPTEAHHIVEHHLRSRREFIIDIDDDGRAYYHYGFTPFYEHLACALFRSISDAFRSCLAPDRVEHHRAVADYLEAILTRCRDLLVARDHLAALAHREALLGGNNAIASEQMYHFRNALVLFTGCLDVLAHAVVELEIARGNPHFTRPARPTQFSWHNLRKGSAWTKHLQHRDAIAIVSAISQLDDETVDLVSFVFGLRDAFQHRRPPASATARFRDQASPGTDILAIAALDLADPEHAPPPAAEVPGIEDFFGDKILIPHRFFNHMVATLARVLNGVVGSVSWPSTDWWRDQRPALDEQLLWLAGFSELAPIPPAPRRRTQ